MNVLGIPKKIFGDINSDGVVNIEDLVIVCDHFGLNGRNSIGEKVATGVYFYTLKAGDFTATRKMLIRK